MWRRKTSQTSVQTQGRQGRKYAPENPSVFFGFISSSYLFMHQNMVPSQNFLEKIH
jgi:hypothetical protein